MENLSLCVPWVELPASPKWVDLFKGKGESLTFPKNTTVLDHGDVVRYGYYVDQGVAKYILNTDCGNVQVAGLLPPGRTFGLGPIFHHNPIILSVITLENSVIFRLPEKEIQQAVQKDADLAIDLVCTISHKLRSVMFAMCLVSTSCAKERLIQYFCSLLHYNNKVQTGVEDTCWRELPIHLSQEQIGEIIGTNRVTVCRLINKFKQEGKLKQEGSQIYISNEWLRPKHQDF